MPKVHQGYTKDIQNIYCKYMPKILEDMINICYRYAKYIPKI